MSAIIYLTRNPLLASFSNIGLVSLHIKFSNDLLVKSIYAACKVAAILIWPWLIYLFNTGNTLGATIR